MSEWNVIHENFHTSIACSQRKMNTCHTERQRERERERERERNSELRTLLLKD